jgi:hypothetical protein
VKGYRLKIKRLDFISAVDAGAQGPISNVALIKRAPKGGLDITCKVTKLDESLGLVFGWAMAGTLDGGKTPHVDLQNDAIDVNSTDFMKACAEFMESGAASDVNHDENTDGRIVFAMPLVKEVNAALGIKSDVEGLAVAMKPSPETFKRFVSGELAAFSIGGVGEREALKRITKEAFLTSDEQGHQHSLDVDDPSTCWLSSYSTSYQTADGATEGHSHAWTFDSVTGVITIGTDSGHTHTIDAVVPPDALAAYLALDAKRDAENAATASDVAPMAVTDEESSGKVSVVVVSARAPQTKSTQAPAVSHRSLTNEDPMPTEQDKTIADLTAKLAKAERIAKLSGAHKAHLDTLSADDAEAFLAKSNAERDALVADVAKRADESNKVVYVSKSTGDVYKAKDDARLIEMAKRMDVQAERSRRRTSASKRAALLGGMPGSDDAHDLIVRSLTKSGAKQEEIDAAFAVLKGMKETSSVGKKAPGAGGVDPESGDSTETLKKFEAGLVAFAKAQNIPNVWTDARAAYIQTTEGAALKRAYDESIAG